MTRTFPDGAHGRPPRAPDVELDRIHKRRRAPSCRIDINLMEGGTYVGVVARIAEMATAHPEVFEVGHRDIKVVGGIANAHVRIEVK